MVLKMDALIMVGEGAPSLRELQDVCRLASTSLDSTCVAATPAQGQAYSTVIALYSSQHRPGMVSVQSVLASAAKGSPVLLLEPSTTANEVSIVASTVVQSAWSHIVVFAAAPASDLAVHGCSVCAARECFPCSLHSAVHSLVHLQGQLKKQAIVAGIVKATSQVVSIGGRDYTLIKGTRPGFDAGAKAAIQVPITAAKPVQISLADDDDMIDEDNLLTEEDRKPVIKAAGVPDAVHCS